MTKKEIDKNKVVMILQGMIKADRPKDKKGNLDVSAFNKLPEIKKAIEDLKGLGVNKKWLWRNGFQVAGLILKI